MNKPRILIILLQKNYFAFSFLKEGGLRNVNCIFLRLTKG